MLCVLRVFVVESNASVEFYQFFFVRIKKTIAYANHQMGKCEQIKFTLKMHMMRVSRMIL